EEAVLLRRDLRRALPRREGQTVGQDALGVAERGHREKRRVLRPIAHDEVAVERHGIAREHEVVAVLREQERAGRWLRRRSLQPDADLPPSRHGRLALGRPECQPQLAAAHDERHLLLELELQTLGRPGRDRRDRDGEERAARWLAPRPPGLAVLLLALLQQSGIDTLG